MEKYGGEGSQGFVKGRKRVARGDKRKERMGKESGEER